jgi:hypothetical protein
VVKQLDNRDLFADGELADFIYANGCCGVRHALGALIALLPGPGW